MSDQFNNTTAFGAAKPEDSTANSIRHAMSLSHVLTPQEPGSDLSATPTPAVPAQAAPANTPEPAQTGAAAENPAASPASTTSTDASGEDGNGTTASNVANPAATAATAATATEPIHREFECMNDEHTSCKTGQYTKDLSRKVISDHFGRNKACTRLIKSWPLFCRKHYQRATYNTAKWQVRKIELILRQFDIIEGQIPGTTYNVVLKKSEEQRLNTYSRKFTSNHGNADEAAAAVVPDEGKHFEAPINVLRELELDLGPNKSIHEVKGTVNLILDMLKKEETKQVPSIEFLPELDEEGRPTKGKTPKKARVSKKGAVKKTKASPKSKSKAKAKA